MHDKPTHIISIPSATLKSAPNDSKLIPSNTRVIVIPPKPELASKAAQKRQLRVAAYCRVSTDDEEQLTSYEAQKRYYTEKIMENPDWSMVDIFADEGITGTSAKKRPEFLRMIRLCKKKQIDLVLTKSISRFARNTVDCLTYIRLLRDKGIAVYFEKENINTMSVESEMMITIYGAFAQAESESMSENIKWGHQRAMAAGRANMHYNTLYAYERGDDGSPKIIPEQAAVVQRVAKMFLSGYSLRNIRDQLIEDKIPMKSGECAWTVNAVTQLLTSEKYVGDVLMQKTFISDCISKKVVKNTGQRPMYLAQNHHEAILDRETFNAVQQELARRKAGKSPSKTATTGRSCYSSKYALTERLFCGECGTLYRRCTWARNGKKKVVWRCVSRLDYGKKYCKTSPSLEESLLQQSILTALNSVICPKDTLVQTITDAMEKELIPIPGENRSIADIDSEIMHLEKNFKTLFDNATDEDDQDAYIAEHAEQFQYITTQLTALKEDRARLKLAYTQNTQAAQRIKQAVHALHEVPAAITEWDEPTIRQLVASVKVISAEQLLVILNDGTEIHQEILNNRQ